MIPINYTCKICGKPGCVEVPLDSDAVAVDKWQKMVCHNTCADLRQWGMDVNENLGRACGYLIYWRNMEKRARFDGHDNTAATYNKKVQQMEQLVARRGEEYCQYLQRRHRLNRVLWTDDLRWAFWNRPESWRETIIALMHEKGIDPNGPIVV